MDGLFGVILIIGFIINFVKKAMDKKQQQQAPIKGLSQHPMSHQQPQPIPAQPQPPAPSTAASQTLSREEIERMKAVLRQRMEGRKATQPVKPVVSAAPSMTESKMAVSVKPTLQTNVQTERMDQRLVSTLDEGVSANYQFGRQRVGSSGASQTLSGYTEGDSPDRCAVPHEGEIGAGAVQVNSKPFFEGKDDLVRAVVLSEVLGQPASRKRKQTVGGQAWRNR